MRGSRGYHKPVVGRRAVLGGLGTLALGCGHKDPSRHPLGSSGTPASPWGVQTGDVEPTRAVVWSRADRPARLVVEWSASPSFADARRIAGPLVTPAEDLCGRVGLEGLPPGQRVHYRARFEGERAGAWVTGSFATPPTDARDVLLAWSGDTNGQGWGIDPARGGMPLYRALLDRRPDLFVHCGDRIYADDPIPPHLACPDRSRWHNVVTKGKSAVAQTLDDYRAAFLYGRHAEEVRALSAAVPLLSIWDDHEVLNNWFPHETHLDRRYTERRVDVLAAYAVRAMLEHTPTLRPPSAPPFRAMRWGPLVELFLLDDRTFRSANWPRPADETYFGRAQAAWLVDALAASTATWKVLVYGQPIGLFVEDRTPEGLYEPDGIGKEDGPPAGREREIAALLSALQARRVRNVVAVTADVHYAAAHHYDPSRAAFRDFDPFWEFVAGPMHATSFPRKRSDDTFGIEVAYSSMDAGSAHGSPATGQQWFGLLRVDGRTGALTVTLVDMHGRDVYTATLPVAA
jgi:alkaline phosphatase D